MKQLIPFIFLACASFSVSADCKYKGNLYPVGTVIGGLVCQADNTWGKKSE